MRPVSSVSSRPVGERGAQANVVRVARDAQRDAARGTDVADAAGDHREVAAIDAALVERGLERRGRFGARGEHDEPRRVAIEPVQEARVGRDRAHLRVERGLGFGARRLRRNSSGLVDDNEPGVAIDDR